MAITVEGVFQEKLGKWNRIEIPQHQKIKKDMEIQVAEIAAMNYTPYLNAMFLGTISQAISHFFPHPKKNCPRHLQWSKTVHMWSMSSKDA